MENLALDLAVTESHKLSPEESSLQERIVCLLKSDDGECFVFCRGHLLSSYARSDLYARNYIIIQLFLCHKVSQKTLSETFGLTVPHISSLVGKKEQRGQVLIYYIRQRGQVLIYYIY